jgi:uncharacterized protein YdhG (YjbR/CyaY superfamily)
MPPKAKNIDGYIKNFPATAKKMLQQIRTTVKKTIPGAEEVISYSIPAFKLHKKILVYFAGWKDHVSIYPVPKANQTLQKEISLYQTGKGTLQFSLDKPLPVNFISKIIKLRVKENSVRAKAKKK